MKQKLIIKNACIVTDSLSKVQDIMIEDGLIARMDSSISDSSATVIDANGNFLLPGLIDDQVHFREPGLIHKATIATESRAALAGGVTSFMEMPNVNPQSVTIELLEQKYSIAAHNSAVNYSFYLGATNDNLEEIKKINPETTCGVKIFMGSSTGDMLVDRQRSLEGIFRESPVLIATHCECETRVKDRFKDALDTLGENMDPCMHPVIRDEVACYLSSSLAVELANKFQSRLHVLHITTALELSLFRNDIPLADKRITSEVCVHHLHFTDEDYPRLGNLIKCNPAIKKSSNKAALWDGLLSGKLDVIATDHAPHTWEEKQQVTSKSPAGLPLVQHSLQLMLEKMEEGAISIELLVEKMCHNPAILYGVKNRGFIREGYAADLVLVNKRNYTVTKDNILYKCGWSPLQDNTFSYSIDKVWVNGRLGWESNLGLTNNYKPQRLAFDRR